jgi:hypothetical protein
VHRSEGDSKEKRREFPSWKGEKVGEQILTQIPKFIVTGPFEIFFAPKAAPIKD